MGTVGGKHRASYDGLIAEARHDPAAFIRLYHRYYDGVFRYCAHRLFGRDAAEDLTSEIFLKVVQSLGCFQGDDERQFRNWLYRIATNTINGHLRKAARRRGAIQRLAEQSRDQVADPPEPPDDRLALLKDAMLTLKPRYQTIITLRFFENLRVTEIAEVLGCSPDTAPGGSSPLW